MTSTSLSFEERDLFPLGSLDSLEKFFRLQIAKNEPDLAFMSILLGIIEHSLTTSANANAAPPKPTNSNSEKSKKKKGKKGKVVVVEEDVDDDKGSDFPPVTLEDVEVLHVKFASLFNGAIGIFERIRTKGEGDLELSTPRSLVKKVSDVVWENLSKSYARDKPHIQTLYTFLTGTKLDCYGVALAVVAGSQVLGLTDVHLALSEDHAWVVFGSRQELDAEVTWHGKGSEDKRGLPIESTEKSWLYLDDRKGAVICDRRMEIASMVSSINPHINQTTDSEIVGAIQQRLLWILFQEGTLEKYPMAIANLGDLEEIQKSEEALHTPEELFEAAIASSVTHYSNLQVYPYTYYGGYLKRKGDYRGAIGMWAKAADVIKNYDYSKNDEEIYKEFFEITTDLLAITKQCSAGISADSPTRNTRVFADVLRFFDGICLWEEDAISPVLHITWAKNWITIIQKFDYSARLSLSFLPPESSESDALPPPPSSSSVDPDSSTPLASTTLYSCKMNAIAWLLGSSEKLNSAAIELQLTAQAGPVKEKATPIHEEGPRGGGKRRSRSTSVSSAATKKEKVVVEEVEEEEKEVVEAEEGKPSHNNNSSSSSSGESLPLKKRARKMD